MQQIQIFYSPGLYNEEYVSKYSTQTNIKQMTIVC